jgi:hypothetical protein
MILDLRCPRCNCPVKGNDEVVVVEKFPDDLPRECRKCNTRLTLKKLKEDRPEPSTHYAFDVAKT